MTARKDEHQHRSSRNFFFNLDVTEKGVFAKQLAAAMLVNAQADALIDAGEQGRAANATVCRRSVPATNTALDRAAKVST